MQQTQQLNATIIYQSAPTSPDVLVVKHHFISALSFLASMQLLPPIIGATVASLLYFNVNGSET